MPTSALGQDVFALQDEANLQRDHWGTGRGLQNNDNIQLIQGTGIRNLLYAGSDFNFEEAGGEVRAVQGSRNQQLHLGNLDVNSHNIIIALTRIDVSHEDIIDTSGALERANLHFFPYHHHKYGGGYVNSRPKFTIKGRNVSGLGDIYFGNNKSKINRPDNYRQLDDEAKKYYDDFHTSSCDGEVVFDSPVTYVGNIYSGGELSNDAIGQITINNNVTFTQKIGYNPHGDMGGSIARISSIMENSSIN